MKKEQLLKGISNLLKKHEDYLNDNPEVFHAIEERFFKAIDDEYDYQDYLDENDPNATHDDEQDYGGDYGDQLFDRAPNEDIYEEEFGDNEQDFEGDEAAKWLADQEAAAAGATDDAPQDNINADENGDVKEEKPKRRSRYLDWKPQDEYKDHHKEAIDKFMEEGYSHREAERLAGAHQAPGDFYSALKHTVNPSEPSPKMLEQMKQLAHGWLKNADAKRDEASEASVNPIRHASAKTIAAHNEAHGDFSNAYNNFINSDEVSGLKGRERHKAIREFKQKWHADNPDHRQNAIAAADSGKVVGEAMDARNQARTESSQALLNAGMSSGDTDSMSSQMAAQMVGGEKGEGGYQTNVKKDPSVHFAENNKAYIDHLRSKLEGKLSPEQTQRMSGIDSFKNKGNK